MTLPLYKVSLCQSMLLELLCALQSASTSSTGDKKVCLEHPIKPSQTLLLPSLPPPALSRLLPENTNLLHHLQLLPEALHLLLYILELILLHPQQYLGQRRGRGTRGDSRATASERPAGPGASAAVEKEGKARRAGAGNGTSSLREQRRRGLHSASCTSPFVTPSHLLQAKAIERRRPPGQVGMEAAGQPGGPPYLQLTGTPLVVV